MKVNIDGLGQAIQEELDAYAYSVKEEVDAAVIRAGRSCLAQIRKNSPKRSRAYRRGWRMQIRAGRLNTVAVIYNRTRWFLIHLLEDGYQKLSGGRVEGEPHVGPAEQQAEKDLEDDIIRAIGGL